MGMVDTGIADIVQHPVLQYAITPMHLFWGVKDVVTRS